MNTTFLAIAAQLTDEALRPRVKILAQSSREVTVELIAHLAVLEVRKLHCSECAGSLFRYCTEILRFSEASACNRIKAARAALWLFMSLIVTFVGTSDLTSIRIVLLPLLSRKLTLLVIETTPLSLAGLNMILIHPLTIP